MAPVQYIKLGQQRFIFYGQYHTQNGHCDQLWIRKSIKGCDSTFSYLILHNIMKTQTGHHFTWKPFWFQSIEKQSQIFSKSLPDPKYHLLKHFLIFFIEKKFRCEGPEIFLSFKRDLNFSRHWFSEIKVQIKWPRKCGSFVGY